MSAQPQTCTHILDGHRCERHVGADGTHGLERHMANFELDGEPETLQWRDVDSDLPCDPR